MASCGQWLLLFFFLLPSPSPSPSPSFSFFFFFFSHPRTCLLILERGEGKEKEREINIIVRGNINWLPLIYSPTRDQTCNLVMCPNQKLNPQPFSLWDDAPTNWATLARTMTYWPHSFHICISWVTTWPCWLLSVFGPHQALSASTLVNMPCHGSWMEHPEMFIAAPLVSFQFLLKCHLCKKAFCNYFPLPPVPSQHSVRVVFFKDILKCPSFYAFTYLENLFIC